MPVFQLTRALEFPPVEYAEPEGLLAVGGDLSAERLLLAYSCGIFPWYSKGEPLLWWSPDPRCVLYPDDLKISKSMKQVLRKDRFRVTMDQAFKEVIRNCSKAPRPGQLGTWITEEMVEAYAQLHELGYAHSVEVWEGEALVGGLYGVALGKCFFGESMFAKVSNASKVGFIHFVERLQQQQFHLIDCQIYTDHLNSLGADEIPRKQFLAELEAGTKQPDILGSWANL